MASLVLKLLKLHRFNIIYLSYSTEVVILNNNNNYKLIIMGSDVDNDNFSDHFNSISLLLATKIKITDEITHVTLYLFTSLSVPNCRYDVSYR